MANDISNKNNNLLAFLIKNISDEEKNKLINDFFRYLKDNNTEKIIINLSDYWTNKYWPNEDIADFKKV